MSNKTYLFFYCFFIFLIHKKTIEYNLQELMLSLHLYNVLYISLLLLIFFFFRLVESIKYTVLTIFLYLLLLLYITGLLWSFSSWGILFIGTKWSFYSIVSILLLFIYFVVAIKDSKVNFIFLFLEKMFFTFIFIYYLLKDNYQTIHQNTKTLFLTEYLINHDVFYLIFYIFIISVMFFFLLVVKYISLLENRRIAQR